MGKVRKYSIGDLDGLINSIKSGYNLKEEEIAVQLGYNEGYISQTRARGFVPDKFMEALKREFAKSNMNHAPVRPQEAQHAPDYRDDIISLLKERLNSVERRQLLVLQTNNALLKTILQVLGRIQAKVDKRKLEDVLVELNNITELHLQGVKKDGS